MISNVEITGIPVSWLIERAGGYSSTGPLAFFSQDAWTRLAPRLPA